MSVMEGLVFYAREMAVSVCCAAASFFALAGTFGLFRFKDVYVRLQAAALVGTPAVFSAFAAAFCAACLSLEPSFAVGGRILIIALFYAVSGSTTTHIIARYAWRSGIEASSKDRP